MSHKRISIHNGLRSLWSILDGSLWNSFAGLTVWLLCWQLSHNWLLSDSLLRLGNLFGIWHTLADDLTDGSLAGLNGELELCFKLTILKWGSLGCLMELLNLFLQLAGLKWWLLLERGWSLLLLGKLCWLGGWDQFVRHGDMSN